jgi:hypothetical protein
MSAFTFTINSATRDCELPANGAGLSTRLVHLVSSSFSGSITVKGRARGTTVAYVAIPYKKRYLNGAVGDDSFVSTAITDTSIIEINGAGLDLQLDCTSYTSGSMDVHSDDMVG